MKQAGYEKALEKNKGTMYRHTFRVDKDGDPIHDKFLPTAHTAAIRNGWIVVPKRPKTIDKPPTPPKVKAKPAVVKATKAPAKPKAKPKAAPKGEALLAKGKTLLKKK